LAFLSSLDCRTSNKAVIRGKYLENSIREEETNTIWRGKSFDALKRV